MGAHEIVSLASSETTVANLPLVKTLIVHRDPYVSDIIRNALCGSQFEVVADCVSGIEALEAFERHQPHVIWLDVKAAKVELLKDLPAAKTSPLIVYLAEEGSTWLDDLTGQEMPFVLRRVDSVELAAIVPRIGSLMTRRLRRKSQALLSLFLGEPSSRQYGRFAFKSGGKLVVLNADEIISIEAEDRSTRLVTSSATYRLKYSLAQIVAGLPSKLFYRISPSAVVNLRCVRELNCGWGSDKFAILNDGRQLRITRSHATQLKKIIDATWGIRSRVRERFAMMAESIDSAAGA